MEVPTLDLKQQYESIRDEIDPAIRDVIDDTAFILGDAVEEFESHYADYCGADHAIGVNSGTAALQLIYDAIGLEEGDEVITSPFTFIATVEPLLHLGARPVFADIKPDSYNIAPENVEAQISDDTEAIVAVHLYGHPADMTSLRHIADEHDLWLIEDAAQAHGARWADQRVGGIGDAAGFSFYPGKNLGAFGDAGAVTTNQSSLAERVDKLRDHGREGKYAHTSLGYNERMDGLQGAVLDVKLDHLDEWNQGRRENATFYNEALESLPVTTPSVRAQAEHIYHQYAIRCPNRDEVIDTLNERDIGAGIHYPVPLHLQESLSDLPYEAGDFPVAEQAAEEVLSLPVFADLTEDQLSYVVDQLEDALDASQP
jgi:dTDP-4-amino-4,6-dideoxygalactose transaminase